MNRPKTGYGHFRMSNGGGIEASEIYLDRRCGDLLM